MVFAKGADPMTNTMRFGRRLNLPSTVQIKHQLLMFWLKAQTEKEVVEATATEQASAPHVGAAVRVSG